MAVRINKPEVNISEKISETSGSLSEHRNDVDNPHEVNKTQVGLGNVDNTSDADKPISTAVQSALTPLQSDTHTHSNKIVLDNTTASFTTAEESSLAELVVYSPNNSIMSKAEFEALAQANRDKFAGSGYVVKGTGGNVNGGIQSVTATANKLTLLEETKSINGVYQLQQEVTLDLPEAPTVTHADSTYSGLITNGTGLTGTTFQQTITTVVGEVYIIEWIDNGTQNRTEYTATSTSYLVDLTGTDITTVSVIPKSAISRQDVVFIRSKAVDTSVKNIWYPLGNSQYLGSDTDGLTGIAAGSFTGFETYSLFGDWQASSALIGKGYTPTTLTAAQQAAFSGNPLNNIYQDGDTIYQEEYKIEVTNGTTDYGSWEAFATEQGFTQDATDKGLWWDGTDKIIPIALVTRKHNQGFYHHIYNKGGTKLASDGLKWYNTTVSFNSTIDCFNPTKLTTASGYISTSASNPDNKFYDAIYASDIIDLRNSAHKNPTKENMLSVVQNAINGTKRSDYDGDSELFSNPVRTQVNNAGFNTYHQSYQVTLPNLVGRNDNTKFLLFLNGTLYRCTRLGYSTDFLYAPTIEDNVKIPNFTSGIYTIFPDIDGSLGLITGGLWLGTPRGEIQRNTGFKSTRKSSGEKLHCDLIGDPAFYPKTTIDYTTTGATQTVSVVKGDKVWYAVASGSTGVGTVGNYYVAKVDQASIDLDTQDFSNTTNWLDTGATNTVDWQGALTNGYTLAGTPLVVGENGEDYIPDGVTTAFKLSQKNKSVALVLKSSDSGVTWSVLAVTTDYTVSTAANTITYTTAPAVGDITMVYYTSTDNYTYPVANTAVLPDGVSDDVYATNGFDGRWVSMSTNLIGKVGVANFPSVDIKKMLGSTLLAGKLGNEDWGTNAHQPIDIVASNPAVKFRPVAVSENGRLCVDLHFKEMKYDDATVNQDGTPSNTWGDDSFIDIADNVTTTPDDNGNTVLIGTKRIKTEFFV